MPDSISLSSLRKKLPTFTSLAEFYRQAFGGAHSATFMAAQDNFMRSTAAYSVCCYVLKLKDRSAKPRIQIYARPVASAGPLYQCPILSIQKLHQRRGPFFTFELRRVAASIIQLIHAEALCRSQIILCRKIRIA